jgi:NAD(P)H-dependent flavin oxidoreductase YrpB (nitropropane dioxygenase family)
LIKEKTMLQTELSRRLGIRHPIMQSGMGGIGDFTLARLAAAVTEAGALGTLAHPALLLEKPDLADPDEIDAAAQQVVDQVVLGFEEAVALTDGPLAINVRAAREQPDSEALLKLIIEMKHSHSKLNDQLVMVSTSGGHPGCFGLNDEIRAAGIFHAHAVSTTRQARSAERAGVDAVVATGFEAAGHIGHQPVHSMILIPSVVDATSLPVLAAGGIADGRSLVAAFALGAQMGYVGTRLLATEECEYSQANKDYVVAMPDTGSRVVAGFFGPARHLDNPFLDVIEAMDRDGVPELERLRVEGEGLRRGSIEGDSVNGFMIGGMGAGRIDSVLPAAEVIRRMVEAAEEEIERLSSVRA